MKLFMINLAGETKADLVILKELVKADIKVVEGQRSRGEVPYTLTGKLGDWNFSRAWYYWMAIAQNGKGLPLDVALELHNRKYHTDRKEQPKTYGQLIRVDGDCSCPQPTGIVLSYHVDTQEGLNALASTIRTSQNIAASGNNQKEIKRLQDKFSSQYVQWEVYEKKDEVEWFKKLLNVHYSHSFRTVSELVVAINCKYEVVSIAKKWMDIHNGVSGIVQHFFESGKITSFNYGQISGPGQLSNRGPEIDDKLRPHYEEVLKLCPNASVSLEHCMRELEKPGPQYKK